MVDEALCDNPGRKENYILPTFWMTSLTEVSLDTLAEGLIWQKRDRNE